MICKAGAEEAGLAGAWVAKGRRTTPWIARVRWMCTGESGGRAAALQIRFLGREVEGLRAELIPSGDLRRGVGAVVR
jgi:hypothetical protein